MLNIDSDMLESLLEIKKAINKKVKIPFKKFVSPKKNIGFLIKDHMSQHPDQQVYPHNKGNNNSYRRCHLFGRYGHIRPFCYKLYGFPQSYSHLRPKKIKGRKLKQIKYGNPRELSSVS